MLFDAVRGGILRDFPPWDSKLDAYQAEEKLVTFMREVLIPLAADTNAVIIGCANHGDCTLSTAFGTALSLEMAKWGGSPPFTFVRPPPLPSSPRHPFPFPPFLRCLL